MSMVTKNITLTDQENLWIKSRFAFGGYSNESEVFSQLIQEQQVRENESPEEIATIKKALIEAKESIKQNGYSTRTVEEIWDEEEKKYLANQNG